MADEPIVRCADLAPRMSLLVYRESYSIPNGSFCDVMDDTVSVFF